MFRMTCLFTLNVLVRFCLSSLAFERDYFFEGKICAPPELYIGQTSSRINCAVLCDQDASCLGFFHSTTDHQCFGVDTYLTPTSSCITNMTYRFYMRHECGTPPAYAHATLLTSTGIVRTFSCPTKYRPTVPYITCKQLSPTPGDVAWDPPNGICTELYTFPCVQDSECAEIGGICAASQCRCAQNLDYDPVQMYCVKRFKLTPGLSGDGVSSGQLLMAVEGAWGNMCIDYWVWTATFAVCKELDASYIYGGTYHLSEAMGMGPTANPTYKLKNLDCGLTGNTPFVDCVFDQIDTGCAHDKDIGITCYTSDITGNIRLNEKHVVYDANSEHRLEVLWDGTWGTVCKQDWGGAESDMACKSIDPALPSKDGECSNSCAGGPAGPYKIDKITCAGDEPHLFFCRNNGWNVTHSCPGYEIGLLCQV